MDKRKKGRNRKKRKKHKKRKNSVFYVLSAAVLLVAGIACIVGILAAVLYDSGRKNLRRTGGSPPQAFADVDREAVAEMKAKLSAVAWQDDWVVLDGKVYSYCEERINLLFLGIDRTGKIEGETHLGDWEAGQTDAIFILSINPVDRTVKIVGIPRNSMVELEVFDPQGNVSDTLYNQICLQYGYAGGGKRGLEKTAEAVSEILYGLPIHGSFAIGYDAVALVNDRLGGVSLTVKEDLREINPLFTEGNHVHLTGKAALQYVRYRDTSRIGTPTGRLERQKQYILELFKTGKEQVKAQPLLITELYNMVSPYMNTDVGLDEALYLATQALGCNFDNDAFYLLRGEDKAVPFTGADGREDFYDDYYLYEDSVREVMKEVFYSEVRLSGEG